MTDLGAGVIDDGNGWHDQHVAGTEAPKTNGPSCPWCGAHGDSRVVNHPHGKYLCGCGSLHNASDQEWRALAVHRKQAIERRIRPSGQEGDEI